MLKKQILLSYFPKITSKRYQQLLAAFATLDQVWDAEFDQFRQIHWDDALIHEFLSWRDRINEDHIAETLDKEGVQCITMEDKDYPPLLKQIHDPPFCLFVRGTIDSQGIFLATVGTRKNTAYGRQVTYDFIHKLAHKNINIVSGLALGIDGIAHKTALQVNGRTIAVLGCGVDRKSVYPMAHVQLAEAIIAGGGAVISEYPPGTRPTKYTFPKRNRIIAGMSLATLVIEAPKSSGALVTAECAIDNNREVFVVPQNITAENSFGPNMLIKQGAALVTSPKDILDALNIEPSKTQQIKQILPDPYEAAIYTCLSGDPQHIDNIIRNTKLPSDIVSSTLTILELKGLAVHLGDSKYIRQK